MLLGKRMVLLVYLHLTLVVQYNIILIIVKSIYTILLFANKQWGCAYTEFSEDGIITVHLPISAKTLAITTNILKNSPSTPQAISNAFILNSNITNEFSICHNLGNQRYAVLYATISQL